ncbi:hypothetical protein Pmar_PMAR000607 [Perkinsus marinus ATCC 50983]|uniref:MULE transposase domain-containing protein n=1 Tax=Perkinsus marinus (strain ATCC 50983 / TXsc) TaxID=423536 RepID=C5KNM8_PERM5|nr:hypothetical protein Pmar_PMAR000607 [Perkinsus marinus ATCC 50983]EER13915.1 hypothetical protein Pmar_PMAR000607 [Perkinsus marinus ATCC 50983]|eukprot:XP_002782120.1 hypothetical protein Pmar_PMAR000607 [Perkinsus marinus ATCC 50983]
MARKTQEEYERALLKLRDVLTGKGLFQIISTLYIITDYELGMRQAILRVWEIDPERLRGCLFHLSKSWIRAYQSEGLASEYWASENVRTPTGRWLRSVIGLPCLSVEECKLAWADMKERKPQGEKIAKLVLYLDSHYMTDTSTFPVSQWASEPVEDVPPQRTTNPLEGYNQFLGNGITARSTFKTFGNKILSLQMKAELRLNSIDAGEAARPTRSKEEQRLRHYQAYRGGRSHGINICSWSPVYVGFGSGCDGAFLVEPHLLKLSCRCLNF